MKANAFRVIKKDLVNFYKSGDLTTVPFLEGFNFNRDKIVNSFSYDHNQKYLHFFDSYGNAKNYLKDTHYANQDDYCICEFYFDEEFLKNNKFQGNYFSKIEMKEVIRDEYIFPIQFYQKENFLKISDPSDYSKHINYNPDNYDDYDIGSIYGKH